MFGLVVCNKKELTKEEQERYQGIYCGLCRMLKYKYGQAARFSLNYDMTFLALLLSALYEPEETCGEKRCMIHPLKKRPCVENPYIEYAADMTILLSYFKCQDDWTDEGKKGARIYAKMLEPHLLDLSEKYPRQFETVKRKVEEFTKLEAMTEDVSDAVINCSGELLSEIFVYKEDYWSEAMKNFGYELGRFIYLMDAVLDYEKDLKSGNYNPFMKKQFDRERAEAVLKIMVGNAMEQFEILPIVRDEGILKNILYGGIWTQYYTKSVRKEKSNGR